MDFRKTAPKAKLVPNPKLRLRDLIKIFGVVPRANILLPSSVRAKIMF